MTVFLVAVFLSTCGYVRGPDHPCVASVDSYTTENQCAAAADAHRKLDEINKKNIQYVCLKDE